MELVIALYVIKTVEFDFQIIAAHIPTHDNWVEKTP